MNSVTSIRSAHDLYYFFKPSGSIQRNGNVGACGCCGCVLGRNSARGELEKVTGLESSAMEPSSEEEECRVGIPNDQFMAWRMKTEKFYRNFQSRLPTLVCGSIAYKSGKIQKLIGK